MPQECSEPAGDLDHVFVKKGDSLLKKTKETKNKNILPEYILKNLTITIGKLDRS